MDNRKRKICKEKKLAEKRRIEICKAQMRELQALKEKIIKLESNIKLQKKFNFKQLNIRNLKIVANTAKFLTPFIISTGITAGIFWLFDGGLPFHLDEITAYKLYSIEMQKDGYATMDNKYMRQKKLSNDSLPSNRLVVYTPWELIDGQYVRFKRDYDIDKLATLNLYNAIVNKNYNYISENLKNYKEEKQILNQIYIGAKNDYLFETNLYVLDENDVLKYRETDFKNTIITIIELILGLGIGGLAAHIRDYEFLDELESLNMDYKINIKALKSMQKELEDTKEKVLSLTKIRGGKVND